MWLQKSREGQNHLLTGTEKYASGVNSQAAVRKKTVASQRICLLCVPGVSGHQSQVVVSNNPQVQFYYCSNQ